MVLQVLVFQKGFKDAERSKLAIVTGQILANALCTPRVLNALFEDHLVKEGGCPAAFSKGRRQLLFIRGPRVCVTVMWLIFFSTERRNLCLGCVSLNLEFLCYWLT